MTPGPWPPPSDRASDTARPPAPDRPRRPWLRVAVATALVAAFVAFVDAGALLRDALAQVERLGPWGPLLFIAAYIVAAVCLVPGSVLTLGAGALFGVLWGSIYVSIGSTLGATAAFLVGRHVARTWVARKIQGNARFEAIDRAVAEQGWRIVALTRLSPVFPFTLLNYAFGLTRVPLPGYILASWIGMMPGTILYVYLGSIARLGAPGSPRSPAQWTLYGLGLAATVAVTIILTRIARRALANRTARVP